MIILICDNIIAMENLQEVEAYYVDLVEYTRKQPGCIQYDVYQNKDRENALVFVEKWAAEHFLEDHLEDPVYQEKFEKIERYLIEDETVKSYEEFV